MEWKYWREIGGWSGSRSYVLETDGRILAHGAAWPSVISAENPIPSFALIDWAADPGAVGAGVELMKRMARLVPVVNIVGGGDMTRRMLVPMGFRPRNDVRTFVCPLRPVRQLLTSSWNWRSPARLARNSIWNAAASKPLGAGWMAREVKPEDLAAAGIPWPSSTGQTIVFERNPSMFCHLAECPSARSAFFAVFRGTALAGYFCLVFTPGLARIVDASASSWEVNDWVETFKLALREARRHPDANEVTALATAEWAGKALELSGFHCRAINPVFLRDPEKRVPTGVTLDFQQIHGDGAFLHNGTPAYVS
jgi:hypothetical protein